MQQNANLVFKFSCLTLQSDLCVQMVPVSSVPCFLLLRTATLYSRIPWVVFVLITWKQRQ